MFQDEHRPASNAEHSKGNDERRHTDKCDNSAVNCADNGSSQQTSDDGQQRVKPCCHSQSTKEAAQANGRAHRKVNAASEDDKENPESNDSGQRDLTTDEKEVSRVDEIRLKTANQYHQPNQCKEDARFAAIKEFLEEVGFQA